MIEKEERKRYYSNPGDPIRIVYGSRIDKHGNIIVEPKEKENLYEYIQSFAESTDINLLVKKFEAGDITALNKREGQFLDLTQMPTNYFEMVNKINDSKYEFDRLPIEIKEKFDNNVNKFIASIGQDDWFEKLGFVKKEKPIEVEKKEEVKEVNE